MGNPHNIQYLPGFVRMTQDIIDQEQPKVRKQGKFLIPIHLFRTLVQDLVTSIREGKLDEKIHLNTAQILYDALWVATEPKPP